MKSSVLIIAALLLTFTGVQKKEVSLEVGAVLPARLVPKKSRILNLYMTGSSQRDPYIEKNVGGIKYIIAYEEESRAITYISTYDKKFKSIDGWQVGGYVEVNREQIRISPGWEIRGPETKDGWETLIGFDHKLMTLIDGAETQINPAQYPPLQSGQTIKVKIKAFVKDD